MTVDRDLLRTPVAQMRAQIEQAGAQITETSVFVLDQLRASWRFDLASLGLDSTDPDQLAGALAGLVLGMKQAVLMLPNVGIGFYVPWVRMFEALEPLLDDPDPWKQSEGVEAPETTVQTPWGQFPGRDLSGLAARLAEGNDVPRFNLGDPADLARLASGEAQGVRVEHLTFASSEELVEWAKGQPWFPAPEPVEVPSPQPGSGGPRLWWRTFRDAYRAERNRRKGSRELGRVA